MHSEVWQHIHRLLLLCYWVEFTDLTSILKVANLFPANLPEIDVQLLILSEQKFSLHAVRSEDGIASFNPILSPLISYLNLIQLIRRQSFDAAVILTTPAQSPYSLAYLCYLAHIPIRLGQSQEFGGGVLSDCIHPASETSAIADYNQHLLQSVGFPGLDYTNRAIA